LLPNTQLTGHICALGVVSVAITSTFVVAQVVTRKTRLIDANRLHCITVEIEKFVSTEARRKRDTQQLPGFADHNTVVLQFHVQGIQPRQFG
jgi:hypothetical protein